MRTLNMESYMTRYYTQAGERLVEGKGDASEDYVDLSGDSPIIASRPNMRIEQSRKTVFADGRDAVLLAGLPVPCSVTVGEQAYEVPDGELEWSTLMPGNYKVRVSAWPFLDWESEVEALEGNASSR